MMALKSNIAAFAVACFVVVAAVSDEVVDRSAWMDPSMPVEERVAALLPKMNIDEKLAMTYATHTSAKSAAPFNTTGIGAVKFMSAFGCGSNQTSCLEQRNNLQALFMNNSRLGIPISFINEGLHGGADTGTIFPMPIGQSHSWNTTLVSMIATAIASEASAIGVDSVFAPVVNMMPDPRFGRLQEGFGENPIITSHMGRASVLALQGGAGNATTYLPEKSVCSLGKHFAAYGAAIGALNGGPADVSNRTLHEVYLRPWLALARAGVRAVMPSHNTVHDIPAHGNEWLIDRTLRQEYGFRGVALSDCNDIGAIFSSGIVKNQTLAAAMALNAGVDWDLQCGGDSTHWGYYKYLKQALDEGLVGEDKLDATVTRVLTQKFAAGLFDNPTVPYTGIADLDNSTHRQLALEAAEQSIVLLQNTLQRKAADGDARPALPMSLKGKKIALFGPLASTQSGEAVSAMQGSYVLSGADVITVDRALASPDVGAANIKWMQGCAASGPPGSHCTNFTEEVALAQDADVSILVLGDGPGQCGEWADRDSLDLAGGQLQLLEAVAGLSPVTIVVLVHGRPQTFGLGNAVLEKVDALFAAWRPGEEGGPAIVNLITGKSNPSAKVVQSWPRTVGQVGGGAVPFLQRVRGKWVANGRNCIGDRCYDSYVGDGFKSTPLFYFGYGLSYTTFAYKTISVTPAAPGAKDWRISTNSDTDVVATVSVTVSNNGTVPGVEVVQLYMTEQFSLPFVPYWKRLIGFGRIELQPGQTGELKIPLLWTDVAQFDAAMTLRILEGTYTITAGGVSNDTPLSTDWTV